MQVMVRLGQVRLGQVERLILQGGCGVRLTAGNNTVVNWDVVVFIEMSLFFSALWGESSIRTWFLHQRRFADRTLVAATLSAPVQTDPGAHTASCTMGTRSSPGLKSGRGVTLTLHPLLVTLSNNSRTIPVFPLKAVRPVQTLSACKRVHFTLLFTLPQRGTRTAIAQWLKRCATNRKVTGSIPADIV